MNKARRLILLKGFRFNTTFKKYMYMLSAFSFMATIIINIYGFVLSLGMVDVCALCPYLLIQYLEIYVV